MTDRKDKPGRFVTAIHSAGLSIYDAIAVGDPELWIPTPQLESILDQSLRGTSLAGLPLRTRSRVVKEQICSALGYPIPSSFRRTQPRFPGQFFDVYVQKSNNLQVWNEELAPTRRYVLIRVSPSNVVTRVKVVTGETLARLDTTGVLTQKYQARCVPGNQITELVSLDDTSLLRPSTSPEVDLAGATPVSLPCAGELFSIESLFDRLSPVVGERFEDIGIDQERNRGGALHELVCKTLGYASYQDDGRFPDVRHQLLEVKLQTSPTIDLGWVRPDSVHPLDVPRIGTAQIRHCDVRYAIFYGSTDGAYVALSHFFLTTGEMFFARFPQFGGRVLNKKLQIPLPHGFFAG